MADLSAKLRREVKGLAIGKPTRPIRLDDGIAILMVCEREAPKSGLPKRNEILDSLIDQRVARQARQYLRDIRLSAIVDLRL